MQNHLVLDFLPAKDGGVYKVIHAWECCVYIPRIDKQLGGYITNITNVTHELTAVRIMRQERIRV